MDRMTSKKANATVATAGNGRDNSAFLQLVVGQLTRHLHKSKVGLMHETFNPLWNITARQAQMIYDYARSGNFAQIQYLYNEIEQCDATFNVCVTRRCSALSELDWKVVKSDQRFLDRAERRRLGDSQALVDEQIACVESAIAKIDNLPDALDHFALSAFRGFSLANIWRDAAGLPTHLECLDHWNIAFDKQAQVWLWNKDAVSYMNPSASSKGMTAIPREDMVAVTRKRQIDWPAMQIFLRNAVGERDWGRFLETYGLPPVIITMPEFTSKDDQQAYVEAAEAVFAGRSGVVPYGSQVNYASESRGTDPFSAFIEHQMKLFVLLATGGTLTSLSEAGSGTLAGNAQMEVWRQIVRADVRLVSNAINKQLCEGIIRNCKDFAGQPILAEFQLDSEPKPSAKDLLELAGLANSAGFSMDAEELSQQCGFTIRKAPEQAGGLGFNAAESGETAHVATIPNPNGTENGVEAAKEPIVALPASETNNEPPIAANATDGAKLAVVENAAEEPAKESAAEELARSLQQDFKPVADELVKVLAASENDRAGLAAELLQRIDTLVPDDPAMAEVLREEMQRVFDKNLKTETK